jgi:hypothetical protein
MTGSLHNGMTTFYRTKHGMAEFFRVSVEMPEPQPIQGGRLSDNSRCSIQSIKFRRRSSAPVPSGGFVGDFQIGKREIPLLVEVTSSDSSPVSAIKPECLSNCRLESHCEMPFIKLPDAVGTIMERPVCWNLPTVNVVEGTEFNQMALSAADSGKIKINWTLGLKRLHSACHGISPIFYVNGCPFKVIVLPACDQHGQQNRKKTNFHIARGRVHVQVKAFASDGPNLHMDFLVRDSPVIQAVQHNFAEHRMLNMKTVVDLKVSRDQMASLSIELALA